MCCRQLTGCQPEDPHSQPTAPGTRHGQGVSAAPIGGKPADDLLATLLSDGLRQEPHWSIERMRKPTNLGYPFLGDVGSLVSESGLPAHSLPLAWLPRRHSGIQRSKHGMPATSFRLVHANSSRAV